MVQEAIDRAMQDRTVLIIAHRLSTVRNASTVSVIHYSSIQPTTVWSMVDPWARFTNPPGLKQSVQPTYNII